MKRFARRRRIPALLALVLAPGAAAADGALAPVGRERQVNTTTAGFQLAPEVASPGEGAFLVTWRSSRDVPGPCSVAARSYRAGGIPTTPADASLAGCDSNAPRTARPAWRVLEEDPLLVWQIDASLQALGVAPFLAGPGELGTIAVTQGLGSSDVAGTADGFLVAALAAAVPPNETDPYLLTRRFSPAGAPLGAAAVFAPPDGERRRGPLTLASHATEPGAWLLWTEADLEPPGYVELRIRRLAADGAPIGAEWQVAGKDAEEGRLGPALAADPLGRSLLAVWEDGTVDAEIRGRAIDAAGVPHGPELAINAYTTGVQSSPDVAAVGDGSFLVVWDSQGSPGDDSFSTSVQGQRVDSGGAPLGGAFQINAVTTQAQRTPRAAALGDGSVMVVWASDASAGDDASHTSIQARVVGPRVFDDGFESGDATAWSGGGPPP